MQILYTGKLAASVVDEFKHDWEKVFPNSEKISFGLRSGTHHSVLQIYGELIDWTLPLNIAAETFLALSALEKQNSLSSYEERILKILQRGECANLYEAVRIINKTICETGNKCNFIITLFYPQEHIQSGLVIKTCNETEIAFLLAKFIISLNSVHSAIIEELKGINPPYQSVYLSVDDKGKVVMKWMDSLKLDKHERVIG